MRVIIKETSQVLDLLLIDRNYERNYVCDFLSKAGALSNGDFVWDEAINAYVCSQETYDWWCKVISDIDILNMRIDLLTKMHTLSPVKEAVCSVSYNGDIKKYVADIKKALDEAFRS